MGFIMKKKIGAFFFALFIIFNIGTFKTIASFEHKNRILFISSYNSSFPIFYQQIDGIKSILIAEDFIIVVLNKCSHGDWEVKYLNIINLLAA